MQPPEKGIGLVEAMRQRIEQQVLSLTGLSLGQLDLENPKGDPGLFGPASISWQVHGDFTSMLIGGIAALMMQMLHPLALAGVWDHSNFRDDMLGRLRRTGQFISGTTFGATNDAEWLIERVRTLHLQITGYAPDGRAYAASDPDLLTWVHVAEASQFLAAHVRYRNRYLSAEDQDRYFDEIAQVATRLGAREVPRSCGEVHAYLQAQRPHLVCGPRCREVITLLLNAPAPSRIAKPAGQLMMQAGIDLLPGWARAMLGLRQSRVQQCCIRGAVRCGAPLLRWAVRDGSIHRARRRLGLQTH